MNGNQKIPTVVSLFAGCGGSSLGYKMAGFKELLAVDWDKNSEEVFKLNFPDVPYWNKDISKLTGQEIIDFCGIPDILDGSPPCQGFSTSNSRRTPADPRNDLISEYVRLIKEVEPPAFIMENVSGMMKGMMKGMFNSCTHSMEKIGYTVSCRLMNAANYGIPQSRQRLIWVGFKESGMMSRFKWPKIQQIITFREAVQNCPNDEEIQPSEKKCYGIEIRSMAAKIKPGRTAQDIFGKGKGFNLARVRWNRPIPTIVKTVGIGGRPTGLLHPTENRFLTIAELKRCQTFPDGFQFAGKFEDKWARIGNSVPPLMMRAIAESLKEALNEHSTEL